MTGKSIGDYRHGGIARQSKPSGTSVQLFAVGPARSWTARAASSRLAKKRRISRTEEPKIKKGDLCSPRESRQADTCVTPPACQLCCQGTPKERASSARLDKLKLILHKRRSADPQIVDALQRGAADAADYGAAIAADQRIGHGLLTFRAIKFRCRFRHGLAISV